MRKIAVVMGSASDEKGVLPCVEQLRELGIPYTVHVLSAHRTPGEAADFAQGARSEGYGALIAAAGKAAHLAGALAARTTLPVIGIPMGSADFAGLDALLSTVQMPSGIPVATVAVGGAKNAALLAAEILSVTDDALAEKLANLRDDMRDQAILADAEVSARLCERK